MAPHRRQPNPPVKLIASKLQAQPAFAWAGTFAETSDGLPLFGRHVQYGPRVLFALAYGENGITYSMLGTGYAKTLTLTLRLEIHCEL